MNILVCLKQILDPERPSRDFRVDAAAHEAERGSAGLVMNIFCANALETALQVREKVGGKITVLTLGNASAEEVLRKAWSLKVDAAVHVKHDFPKRPNPFCVARILSAAIRKLGNFDLILTGRESGDWGDGQTGGLLAEELKLPCFSFVDDIESNRPLAVLLRKQTDQGCETWDVALPTVATITNHKHNVPRIAKTRDVMQAFKQPITTLSLTDIGLDEQAVADEQAAIEVVDLVIPVKQIHCEMVTGETLDDRITAFAKKIVATVQAG